MDDRPPAPASLPPGAELLADGWAQVIAPAPGPGPRRALFLDRDGVVVDEVHYLHRVEDTRLVAGAAATIRDANAHGIAVVLVTNQAGIGYGKYGWAEFMAVQDAMLAALKAGGAAVDAVMACPHHDNGMPPYDVADHPWRKPNPGMLLAAAERLPLELSRSWIVGDRSADILAGRRAGLAGGVHVLTGHGAEIGERDRALALGDDGFAVHGVDDIGHVGWLLPVLF